MVALFRALDSVEAGDARTVGACEAIRLLALTGCRLREILGLTWAEVHAEAGLLKLRDSKTGPRVVYLTEPAAVVLERRPRTSDWVFPSSRRDGPSDSVRRTWAAACKAAGITDARPHDLRHAYASRAARAGLTALEIKPLTGHADTRVLERYVHSEAESSRRAAERVQAVTTAMLEGRAVEVVQLTEHRG